MCVPGISVKLKKMEASEIFVEVNVLCIKAVYSLSVSRLGFSRPTPACKKLLGNLCRVEWLLA